MFSPFLCWSAPNRPVKRYSSHGRPTAYLAGGHNVLAHQCIYSHILFIIDTLGCGLVFVCVFLRNHFLVIYQVLRHLSQISEWVVVWHS